MMRFQVVAGLMMSGLLAQAADGSPIARAMLQTRTGATVASAQADPNGTVRFMNVPPGEYRLVLTNAAGRSVTLADLGGEGIIIEGLNHGGTSAAPAASAGHGKVNMQDLSVTKRQTQGATFGEKSPGVVSPRDAASGLPTGRRMHKPFACLVDWDGTVKGGFPSEMAARMEGQRLPENTNGRCAIKVMVDEQPGTIEVLSWSWGTSNAKHTKTGHVTLMK